MYVWIRCVTPLMNHHCHRDDVLLQYRCLNGHGGGHVRDHGRGRDDGVHYTLLYEPPFA